MTRHICCFDSAIHFFNRSVKSARTTKEAENARLEIAVCLGQKADILIKKGKHEEAISTFLSVLEAWRASDAPRKNIAMGTYYAKISTLYYELKQFEKALQYDKLALSMYMTEDNEEAIAWAYVYVCDDFIALKQMDSCLLYLNKAKPIAERLNNHRLNVQYYNKLGQISLDKKDYRSAIVYFEKCVLEATITNTKSQILSNQRMIAVGYVRLGEFAAARKYLLLALPEAVGPNFVKSKMEILQDLVTVEEGSDRPGVAYGYLKQVVTLRDSLNQEASKKAVAEIESKYRTTENEKTILGLEKDKQIQSLSIQQHSSLNYFLGGSLTGLLLLAFSSLSQSPQPPGADKTAGSIAGAADP